MDKDKVAEALDELEYNLMDGMSIPLIRRQFTQDEYDLIRGVFILVRKRIGVE